MSPLYTEREEDVSSERSLATEYTARLELSEKDDKLLVGRDEKEDRSLSGGGSQ